MKIKQRFLYIRPAAAFIAFVLALPAPGYPQNSVLPPIRKVSFQSRDLIRIPAALGQIETEQNSGTGKPLAVVIQDAHAIRDAQMNMGRLIRHLAQNYGIQAVGVEGSKGDWDTTLIRAVPDSAVRNKILREYFSRGELTGAQYAAAAGNKNIRYTGVEDWKLYDENYSAYLSAVKRQPEALGELAIRRKDLDARRLHVFSKELNEFFETAQAFENDPAHIEAYLFALKKYANLPEMRGKYQILEPLFENLENQSVDSRIDSEIKKWAAVSKQDFLRHSSESSARAWAAGEQSYSTGQITAREFLRRIAKLARREKIRVRIPAEFKNGWMREEKLNAMRGSKVFEALEALRSEIETRLAGTVGARALLAEARRLSLEEDLARLKLTQKEFLEYQKDFAADAVFAPFQDAFQFYKLAEARNRAIFENFKELIRSSPGHSAILVAGGFHKEGLVELLKQEGYHVVAVLPRIRSLAGEERYPDLMKGEVSYKSFLHTTFFDAFSRHFALQVLSRRGAGALPAQAKLWRDQILRELSDAGRIARASDYTRYIDLALKDKFEDWYHESPADPNLDAKLARALDRFNQEKLREFDDQINAQLKTPAAGFSSAASPISSLQAAAAASFDPSSPLPSALRKDRGFQRQPKTADYIPQTQSPIRDDSRFTLNASPHNRSELRTIQDVMLDKIVELDGTVIEGSKNKKKYTLRVSEVKKLKGDFNYGGHILKNPRTVTINLFREDHPERRAGRRIFFVDPYLPNILVSGIVKLDQEEDKNQGLGGKVLDLLRKTMPEGIEYHGLIENATTLLQLNFMLPVKYRNRKEIKDILLKYQPDIDARKDLGLHTLEDRETFILKKNIYEAFQKGFKFSSAQINSTLLGQVGKYFGKEQQVTAEPENGGAGYDIRHVIRKDPAVELDYEEVINRIEEFAADIHPLVFEAAVGVKPSEAEAQFHTREAIDNNIINAAPFGAAIAYELLKRKFGQIPGLEFKIYAGQRDSRRFHVWIEAVLLRSKKYYISFMDGSFIGDTSPDQWIEEPHFELMQFIGIPAEPLGSLGINSMKKMSEEEFAQWVESDAAVGRPYQLHRGEKLFERARREAYFIDQARQMQGSVLPVSQILHELSNTMGAGFGLIQLAVERNKIKITAARALGPIYSRIPELLASFEKIKKNKDPKEILAYLRDLYDLYSKENVERAVKALSAYGETAPIVTTLESVSKFIRGYSGQILGKEPPQLKKINIGDVLQDVSSSEPGYKAEWKAESGISTVTTYPIELYRALKNLYVNAMHATQNNPARRPRTIQLRSRAIDPKAEKSYAPYAVAIDVEDNGTGIKKEDLPKIFEPHFTTKGEEGTGIGLAMVKHIVEDMMGGKIEVKTKVGKGTTFTIYLPDVPPHPGRSELRTRADARVRQNIPRLGRSELRSGEDTARQIEEAANRIRSSSMLTSIDQLGQAKPGDVWVLEGKTFYVERLLEEHPGVQEAEDENGEKVFLKFVSTAKEIEFLRAVKDKPGFMQGAVIHDERGENILVLRDAGRESLEDWFKEKKIGKMSYKERAGLALPLMEIFHEIKRLGYVHSDLKPEHIRFTLPGNAARAAQPALIDYEHIFNRDQDEREHLKFLVDAITLIFSVLLDTDEEFVHPVIFSNPEVLTPRLYSIAQLWEFRAGMQEPEHLLNLEKAFDQILPALEADLRENAKPRSELRSALVSEPAGSELRRDLDLSQRSRYKQIVLLTQQGIFSRELLSLWTLLGSLESQFPNAEKIFTNSRLLPLIKTGSHFQSIHVTSSSWPLSEPSPATIAESIPGIHPESSLVIYAGDIPNPAPKGFDFLRLGANQIVFHRGGKKIFEERWHARLETSFEFQSRVLRNLGFDGSEETFEPFELSSGKLSARVMREISELKTAYPELDSSSDRSKPLILINPLYGSGEWRGNLDSDKEERKSLWEKWSAEIVEGFDGYFIFNEGPESWDQTSKNRIFQLRESVSSSHYGANVIDLGPVNAVRMAALIELVKESGGLILTEHSGLLHMADLQRAPVISPGRVKAWKGYFLDRPDSLELSQDENLLDAVHSLAGLTSVSARSELRTRKEKAAAGTLFADDAREAAKAFQSVNFIAKFTPRLTAAQKASWKMLSSYPIESLLNDFRLLSPDRPEYALTVRAMSFNHSLLSYARLREAYPEFKTDPVKAKDLIRVMRQIQYIVILSQNDEGHPINRRTWEGRNLIDVNLIDAEVKRYPEGTPVLIGDVAVSDGTSAYELALRYQKAKQKVKIIGYDKMFSLRALKISEDLFAFFDADGTLIQVVQGGDKIYPRARLKADYAAAVEAVYLEESVQSAGSIELINLLNPEAEDYARAHPDRLEFKEHNVFNPLLRQHQFLRVAGLLIRGEYRYFSDGKIKLGLAALGQGLVESGALLNMTAWKEGYRKNSNFDLFRKQGETLKLEKTKGYETQEGWSEIAMNSPARSELRRHSLDPIRWDLKSVSKNQDSADAAKTIVAYRFRFAANLEGAEQDVRSELRRVESPRGLLAEAVSANLSGRLNARFAAYPDEVKVPLTGQILELVESTVVESLAYGAEEPAAGSVNLNLSHEAAYLLDHPDVLEKAIAEWRGKQSGTASAINGSISKSAWILDAGFISEISGAAAFLETEIKSGRRVVLSYDSRVRAHESGVHELVKENAGFGVLSYSGTKPLTSARIQSAAGRGEIFSFERNEASAEARPDTLFSSETLIRKTGEAIGLKRTVYLAQVALLRSLYRNGMKARHILDEEGIQSAIEFLTKELTQTLAAQQALAKAA